MDRDGAGTGRREIEMSAVLSARVQVLFLAMMLLPSSSTTLGNIEAAGESVLVPPGSDFSPATPLPPAQYRVPMQATRVNSVTALARALVSKVPTDVELTPGIFSQHASINVSSGGGVQFSTAHRLWSSKLAGAVIRVGLTYDMKADAPGIAATGAQLHGLKFAGKQPEGALGQVSVPFSGKVASSVAAYLSIEDCEFDGEGVADAAIFAQSNDGLTVRRIVVRNFTRWGLRLDQYMDGPHNFMTRRIELSDLDISQVAMPYCGDDDGRSEAGLWLGNTALAKRIRVRDCGWMGVWTGSNCFGCELSDLDIDRIGRSPADGCNNTVPRYHGVGVYMEHFTYNAHVHDFRIGHDVGLGFNSEWNDGIVGNEAGQNNTISAGVIQAKKCGIYADFGTFNETVRGVRFERSTWAGVGFWHNNLSRVEACDFSGLPTGALHVATAHIP